jgi:phosphoserine phosphatase RsbU/P
MAVPLQTDDNVLGMLYVDSLDSSRRFMREDLELLTVLANVAAIRIEGQRLQETEAARRRLAEELAQAAEIQRQFLPVAPPDVRGLALAGHSVSCRAVGGDYYDYLRHAGGRVGVLIADVCGKGLPAALLMMGFQARVQVLAEECEAPAELARKLNRGLSAGRTEQPFVSFFFVSVDPASGQLRYCNAGHNPPILLREGGDAELLKKGGPVLGILPEAQHAEGTAVLGPGDVLLLYSDGLTEAAAPDGQEFGEDRLLALLREERHLSVAELSSRISDAVQRWMAGTPAADDITFVLARRVDGGAPAVA